MIRRISVSLGALAMGLVVIRGAINGELAGNVAIEAIAAMIVFMGIGWVAGWISDYLVRDSLERNFRARVQWYRQGLLDSGFIEPETNDN